MDLPAYLAEFSRHLPAASTWASCRRIEDVLREGQQHRTDVAGICDAAGAGFAIGGGARSC